MNLFMEVISQTIGALICVIIAIGCALLYFQRVRLERPAVGVFNVRDVGLVFIFVIILPLLYVRFPSIILTAILALTFAGALYIGLRPFLQPLYLWILILVLLLSDIVVTEALRYTHQIMPLYWSINSVIVLCAAVGVANLYIQGGMRLKHVAWFAFFLAFYDGFSAFVIPLTAQLAEIFTRQPLNPTMGFAVGNYVANIGLGDVLLYCLFIVAAYKGFGKRGAITAFVVITSFGVVIPSFSVLLISAIIPGKLGTILPVQVFFGPVALITYFWLSWHMPERTMAQWFAFQASLGHKTLSRTVRRVQPVTTEGDANAYDARGKVVI